MKKIFLFYSLIGISLSLFAQKGKELTFQKWALTPPMGWNSWDCYGPTVVESEVKANADYMATYLKQYGWEYVVVDIRWFVENDKAGGYNQTDQIYDCDAYGRYMPAVNRFPSAANGKGFKPLADYIHSKGLKFGIHIMRGIPKLAVDKKLPIKDGNGKTAADIYTTAGQCTWLKDNYTILSDKPGAQEYYNSIFELYASWGIDFVKIDDLSRPYHQGEIELIRKAIDKTGRAIVLSMSPGETPVDKFEHVKTHANMWRTVDDFWDNWDQLHYQFGVCNRWSPYIAPGTWPDADMLPLGRISIRGERGADRMTKFTHDEQYTLMSLWSIFKSPLMFGGDLPSNDAFTKALITNNEVLDMHKRSVNNKQWFKIDDQIAWTADDPNNGDKFVALFNTSGNEFVKTRKALYRSGLISKLTDGYGINIDIKIPAGSKELYLVVSNGGDGNSWDHADWINPVLYKENGDSILLSDMVWENATTGWGTITKNKSISGAILNVQGKTYNKGIGTHANSIIFFKIPEGISRLKTFAGLDRGATDQANGTSVEFMIFNQNPTFQTSDPDENSEMAIPLDLVKLGFTGECNIRDMWAKKDLGTFTGNAFAPIIKQHGAGLYRVSALNRSNGTTISLSASSQQTNSRDTVLLNVSVQKISSVTEKPSGSIVIYDNKNVVGILQMDNAGNAQFTATSLTKWRHTFNAKYSGSTIYLPQLSNSVTLEVKNSKLTMSALKASRIKAVSIKR